VILSSLQVDPAVFALRTAWQLRPEGACKADTCVPLPAEVTGQDGRLDARILSQRLHMPLVEDEKHGLWSLGPESGGRTLATARFPDLTLPTGQGQDFDFRSLRGQKVLLLAWASW
jgi:hypothetical protein